MLIIVDLGSLCAVIIRLFWAAEGLEPQMRAGCGHVAVGSLSVLGI
jgi:hypothetical protein